MNDVNNNQKKSSISKKIRYGSSAIAFTVLFVVFVLLINVVLSYFANETDSLYLDLTTHELYTLGDASKEALKDVKQPIEIIFTSPEDIIESDELWSGVNRLCKQYTDRYDNISVSYHDVLSEVAYFNKFKATSADVIDSNSMIVYCPSANDKGISKILTIDKMYKLSQGSNGDIRLFAFDGESKLTNAFLTVTGNAGKTLKAGFISGHNENINDILKAFLENNGYVVDTVELKKASATQLAQYDLLIVCEPRLDFAGKSNSGVNEIELLRNYVMSDFGNLMFFTSYTASDMPELFALLEDSFGVKVNNSSVIVEGNANAVPESYGLGFFGSYSKDADSYGYGIHKAFSEGSSRTYPLLYGCSHMEIIPKDDSYFDVSPILVTSEEAVSFDGETAIPHAGKPLMTLSRYIRLVNNVDKSSNVIVCSSSDFLYYLEQNSFSNADIISSILVEINNADVAADIPYKPYDDNSIFVRNDDKDKMIRWLGFIAPSVILVIGAIVFIKRKYL